MSVIEDSIKKDSFMQLVKSKNKQSEVSVIKKSQFLTVTGLNDEMIAQLEPLVFLNAKFTNIY